MEQTIKYPICSGKLKLNRNLTMLIEKWKCNFIRKT